MNTEDDLIDELMRQQRERENAPHTEECKDGSVCGEPSHCPGRSNRVRHRDDDFADSIKNIGQAFGEQVP